MGDSSTTDPETFAVVASQGVARAQRRYGGITSLLVPRTGAIPSVGRV
jgi:hypothetical protein